MNRLRQLIGPALGLFLFAFALYSLRQQLKANSYRDVVAYLRELPASRLGLALVLTAVSYLFLVMFDKLALALIQRRLPHGRVALTSFIGYAFSHNLGFALLSGGSVRYRLYSAWGLTALEVSKVVVFGTFTFLIGFLSAGAVSFVVSPFNLPEELGLPFRSVQPIGFACLAAIVAYLVFSGVRSRPLRIRQWLFELPTARIAALQVLLSLVDWLLVGSVLWALLPPSGLPFVRLLGVLLIAQFAGVMSQVPAGLGVFETVLFALLPEAVSRPELLGGIVAFRGVYYLLPLAAAVGLLGTHETLERRRRVRSHELEQTAWALGPHLLALTAFVAGAVLLFSAATPRIAERVAVLDDLLPLAAIELGSLLCAISGVALLLLARGLQRRLRAAYKLSVVVLCAGILGLILGGLDWEASIALTLALAALAPCRSYFVRRASLTGQAAHPAWVAAGAAVLLGGFWLWHFTFERSGLMSEGLWRFALGSEAQRALRALVTAAAVGLGYALLELTTPTPRSPGKPSSIDLAHARAVIATSGSASAWRALDGDKELIFNETGDAFLMFAREGRTWAALGEPVGPRSEHEELCWRFHELVAARRGWTVFHAAAVELRPVMIELGLTLLPFAERATLGLDGMAGGSGAAALAEARRAAAELGLGARVVEGDAARALERGLPAGAPPIATGFMRAPSSEAARRHNPSVVVERSGRPLALAALVLAGTREAALSSLAGLEPVIARVGLKLALLEAMAWAHARGIARFDLGLAPVAGLEKLALLPLSERLGPGLFEHGEHFASDDELRAFKEEFAPVWDPVFVASPGGLALPSILKDLATLGAPGRPAAAADE